MYTRICKRRLNKEKLATLNVELCAGRNVEWLPLAILNVVIGFAACLSKNVELSLANACDCELGNYEQELIVVISSVPLSKASQSFS